MHFSVCVEKLQKGSKHLNFFHSQIRFNPIISSIKVFVGLDLLIESNMDSLIRN